MPAAVAVTNGGTRLKTPTALPGSAEMLTVDANGQLATQAIPSAGISGSLGSTDNALLRADGTGGATAQGSSSTLSDAGALAVNGSAASVRSYDSGGTRYVEIGENGSRPYVAGSHGNLRLINAGTTSGYIEFADTAGNVRARVNMIAAAFDAASGITMQNGRAVMGTGGSGFLDLIRSDGFAWRASAFGSYETGIISTAAGVLQITNGTSGTYRDLLLRNLTASGVIQFGSYTVATLPSSPADGQIAFASNGRKSGEGAGTGTGVFVYSDGGTWYDNINTSSVVAA